LKLNGRECNWNLVVTVKDNATFYMETHIYVNGRFWYVYTEDYGGNVLSRKINRADIAYERLSDSTVFSIDGGYCRRSVGGSIFSGLGLPSALIDIISSNKSITYANCQEDVEWEGMKGLTKYWNTGLTEVYAKKGELRGFYHVLSSMTGYYTFDWGSYAPMSKFSFSKRWTPSCPDDKIFSNPSDDYVLCAASSSKAALILVLAALCTALLALF